MRLDTRLLLAANSLFPRPNLPGHPELSAYAAWEYRETAAQLEELRKLGFSLGGGRLLDLGCGLGGKAAYCAEHSQAQVLGIDLSWENVETAREFARSRSVTRLGLSRTDATALPLRAGSMDAILATDVFEHLRSPEIVLREAARVLKPGGLLAISFGPFGSPLGSHLYDLIYVPWCHLLFPREALAEAAVEVARRRGRGLDPTSAARELVQAHEQVRYYNEDVNRMTLRKFFELAKAAPGFDLVAWRKRTPGKLRMLQPLVGVPGLDEVLTGMLSVVMRRS